MKRLFSLLCVGNAAAFFVPICDYNQLRSDKATVFHVNGVDVALVLPTRYEVVAFEDHCPHRGASFNDAKTTNSSLICNYHAYEFAIKSGALQSGLGVHESCTLHLQNVPVLKRGKTVWGSVDGDIVNMPPALEFEHFEHPFHTISGRTTIKCTPQSLIENVLDNIHVSYVHSFGNPSDPEPKNYTVSKLSNRSSRATFQYHSGKTSMFPNSNVQVENWFYTPCTASTRVSRNGDVKLVQVHAVDRGKNRTEIFWSLSRNFLTWSGFDFIFRLAMMVTLAEDAAILETLVPERGDKVHSKYDALQLHYRRAMLVHQNISTEPLH